MDYKFRVGTVVFDHWQIVKSIKDDPCGSLYKLAYRDQNKDYQSLLKVVSVPHNLKDLIVIFEEGNHSLESYVESVKSFVQEEIDLMAKLGTNPHIITYFDHKIEPHPNNLGCDILMRMELLSTFEEYTDLNCLSRGDIIQMGVELCKALEGCHEKGIIHRDIRPEHIYVTNSGEFKLGNFAVPCLDPKQEDKGLCEYMAPELYNGQKYNRTVDIYALSMVLYRLLNRNRIAFMPDSPVPHSKERVIEARNRRLEGEDMIPAPYFAKKGKLIKVLRKACHPDTKQRYQSATIFRQDLENLLPKQKDRYPIYPYEVDYLANDTTKKRNYTMASWLY